MESKQVEAIAAVESEVKAAIDPLPAGTLGMYLFLASEAMFFVALFGSLIILESASGQHRLFERSSWMLNVRLGIAGAALLLLSTLAILFGRMGQIIALIFAFLFVIVQSAQWLNLLSQHTYVEREGNRLIVIDGTVPRIAAEKPFYVERVLSADLLPSFNLHGVTRFDIGTALDIHPEVRIQPDELIEEESYGPSRNNYFAMYFLLTSTHILHLMAGIAAILWFVIIHKSPSPGGVQIYWHFVNVVGVLTLVALYFV